MDKRRTPRQRHEEAELLRQTARSTTTPGYFRLRGPGRPRGSSLDHAIDVRDYFADLFGAFTSDGSWPKVVLAAMVLAPQALACLLLIIAMTIVQGGV
ncbi:MAG: hypothetical protein AAF563_11040 [Pseudomonadota bacterium]